MLPTVTVSDFIRFATYCRYTPFQLFFLAHLLSACFFSAPFSRTMHAHKGKCINLSLRVTYLQLVSAARSLGNGSAPGNVRIVLLRRLRSTDGYGSLP